MTDNAKDPIGQTARFVTAKVGEESQAAETDELERRLKHDIFNSVARIKPSITESVDFEKDVLSGRFFEELPAPLQGIAIARCEGTLAYYNRIGWHRSLLSAPLSLCVPEDGLDPLSQRYHANNLHDLAYVHPKHFEKMLGKAGSASLWETLKRHVEQLNKHAES